MKAAPTAARTIGRYALHREIAAGGMATVHLGRLLGPVGFSRTVAIKRLHPHLAKDPEFVSMFLDEARLAARIRHPNVVATMDVVALEGELFLVMEYVQGESLARLVRETWSRGERVPPRVAVGVLCNALSGLHAAHEAVSERRTPLGIVHRDVSPHNILVGTDGVARVVDFGVAKAAGRLQTTREGQLKGKLAYMAPEQIRGESIDRRADVYAASVILWEVLAGQRLFDGDEASLLYQVLHPEIPPLDDLADVPPDLRRLLERGLSLDPDERFVTALDMADALEQALTPASPRQIAAWVEQTGAEVLQSRAAMVAEVEQTCTGSGPLSVPRSSRLGERPEGPASARVAAGRVDPAADRAPVSSPQGPRSSRAAATHTAAATRRREKLVLGGALLVGGAGALLLARDLPSGAVDASAAGQTVVDTRGPAPGAAPDRAAVEPAPPVPTDSAEGTPARAPAPAAAASELAATATGAAPSASAAAAEPRQGGRREAPVSPQGLPSVSAGKATPPRTAAPAVPPAPTTPAERDYGF